MVEGWLKPEQNCKFYWKNNRFAVKQHQELWGLLSIDSVRFLAQKILGNLSSDFLFEKRKQKSVKNCFVKNRLQIVQLECGVNQVRWHKIKESGVHVSCLMMWCDLMGVPSQSHARNRQKILFLTFEIVRTEIILMKRTRIVPLSPNILSKKMYLPTWAIKEME